MKEIRSFSKGVTIGILLVLYVIPPIGITVGLIPFHYRFYVLGSLFGVTVYLAYRRRLSVSDLGLGKPPLLFTILLAGIPIAVLYILVWTGHLPPRGWPTVNLGFLLFFVCFSAPVQEFIYRSFLFSQLRAFPELGAVGRVLCSAFLYGMMHVIYRDFRTVVLTIVVGLLWGGCYEYTRNLWVVVLSHAVLGLVALRLRII